MGPNYCYLLTPADLSDAGVPNVGQLSTNEYDNNFYCVYAGKSAATGGIELDAFIISDPTTLDENYGYIDPGATADDVKASVPGADKARLASLSSGGADFGTIAVQSGNLIFGLSIPPTGDWKTRPDQTGDARPRARRRCRKRPGIVARPGGSAN